MNDGRRKRGWLKRIQCFYLICILYTKIPGLALNVTFWHRINLTNFTLRLEIQKIINGCNR